MLPGVEYDVEARFVSGRLHTFATNRALQYVTDATVPQPAMVVRDVPAIVNVTCAPPSGFVGTGANVTLSFLAAFGESTLRPAGVFINGIDVSASWRWLGGGAYSVTLTVPAGAAGGQLQLSGSITDDGSAATTAPVSWTGGAGAAVIDSDVPVAVVSPASVWVNGSVSAAVNESFTVQVMGEPAPCNFSYTLAGAVSPSATVTTTRRPLTGDDVVTVGPFQHGDMPVFTVRVVDAAGNRGAPFVWAWEVDLVSPATVFALVPPLASASTESEFQFECSKPNCTFSYNRDGVVQGVVAAGNSSSSSSSSMVDGDGYQSPPQTVVTPSVGRVTVSTVASFVLATSHNGTQAPVTARGQLQVQWGSGAATSVQSSAWLDVFALPGFNASSSTLTLTGVAPGLQWFAAQALRNTSRDPSPWLLRWTVLASPPSLVVVVRPPAVALYPTAVATIVWRTVDEPVAPVLFEYRRTFVGDTSPPLWLPAASTTLTFTDATPGVTWRCLLRARYVMLPSAVTPNVDITWTSPPCSTLTVAPVVNVTATATTASGAAVAWACADAAAAFEYSVDGGTWTATAATHVLLSGLATGVFHGIDVRAAAPEACASRRPAAASSRWFQWAPSPGDVAFVTAPSATSASTFASFAVNATASPAFFECSLDGEPPAPCDATFRVGPLSLGPHNVTVASVSSDGSARSVTAVHSWSVVTLAATSLTFSSLSDGWHNATVTAVDAEGRRERSPRTYRWLVDTLPPSTRVTLLSPTLSNVTTARAALACDGEVVDAAVQCTLCWNVTRDTVVVRNTSCSSSTDVRVASLLHGSHVLTAWSIDAAGNVDATPAVAAFVVDTEPPTVSSVTVVGSLPVAVDGMWVIPSATCSLVVLCADCASVSVSVSAAVPSSSPYAFGSAAASGGVARVNVSVAVGVEAAVVVVGVDSAGNAAAPTLVRVFADVGAPVTVVRVAPAAATNAAAVAVTLAVPSSSKRVGLVRHFVVNVTQGSVAGNASQIVPAAFDSTANVVVDVAGVDGTVVLSAVAVDRFNRADAVGVLASFVVDRTAPVVTLSQRLPAFVAASSFALSLAVDDATTPSVSMSVDSGAVVHLQPGRLSVPLSALVDGPHTVTLLVVDAAGNAASPLSLSFTVDTAAPLLLPTRLPGTFTNRAAVTVCVQVTDASASNWTLLVDGVEAVRGVQTPCIDETLTGEGNHSLTVRAADSAGNTAAFTAYTLLDTLRPVVTASLVLGRGCTVNTAGAVPAVVVCGAANVAVVNASCASSSTSSSVAMPMSGMLESPCALLFQLSSETVSVLDVQRRCIVARNQSLEGRWDPVQDTLMTIATDGQPLHRLRVVSRDDALNYGAVEELEFWVDTARPLTPTLRTVPAVVSLLEEETLSVEVQDDSPGEVSFVWTLECASDATVPRVSGVAAALPVDTDATRTWRGSIVLSSLRPPLQYRLSVSARDQAGWTSPAAAVYRWRVVAAVPSVALRDAVVDVSGLSRPTIVLRAVLGGVVEPHAQFEVQLLPPPGVVSAAAITAWTDVCAAMRAGAADGTGSGNGTGGFNDTGACLAQCSGAACPFTTAPLTPGRWTLRARAVLLQAVGADVLTVSWEYRRCSAVEFAVLTVNGSVSCHPCPAGGDCALWADSTSDPAFVTEERHVVAKRGYWAPPNMARARFYPCPRAEACAGGVNGSRTLCGSGYDGVLCGVCSRGYFEQYGRCALCPGNDSPRSMAAAVFLPIVLVVCFGILFKLRGMMARGMMKVGVSMVQIIGTANSAYEIPWPSQFSDLLDGFKIFLVVRVG